MHLLDLLRQHCPAAAESDDWAQCAVILTTPSIEVRDPTPLTYRRLIAVFGDESRQLVAATLRSVSRSGHPAAGEIGDAHLLMLQDDGVQINTDARQQMIDMLAAAGSWPESLRSDIKSLGVRRVSLAQQHGLSDADCTPDRCRLVYERAALEAIADAAYQSFVGRYNAAKTGIDDGSLATAEQVLAVLSGSQS